MSNLNVIEFKSGGLSEFTLNTSDKNWKVWKDERTLYLKSQDLIDEYKIKKSNSNKNAPIFNKNSLDYLDIIETASILAKNPFLSQESFELLALARIILEDFHHKEADYMFYGLQQYVANTHSANISEIYVQGWFEDNYKRLLGDEYELITRESNRFNVPDCWVMQGNKTMPVEVKLHSFDKKAYKQLTRYMEFYNCSHGIAVAKKLKYKLPDNIKFIAYDEGEVIENMRRMFERE